MRFLYFAELQRGGPDEVVVSFRDLPECLTSGADEDEALFEAQDALEEAVAGRINRGDTIPVPSERRPGEYSVAVPTNHGGQGGLCDRLSAERPDALRLGPTPR